MKKQKTQDSKEDESGKITCINQFEPYRSVLDELTVKTNLKTDHPLVNVVITMDSKNCIAIAQKNDEEFEVQGYCLSHKHRIFTVPITGLYLKVNLIEQNDDGQVFFIAYQDNGHFYVRFINVKGEQIDFLDVTDFL